MSGLLDAGERSFSSMQVCDIARVTYRQLDYWDRTGLIVPSIVEANRPGSRRRYSYEDLTIAWIVAELKRNGFWSKGLDDVVECLRAGVLPDDVLVIQDGKISVSSFEKLLTSELATVIQMRNVLKLIDTRVEMYVGLPEVVNG